MVLGKLPAIICRGGFYEESFIHIYNIYKPALSSYVIFICKNSHLAPCSRTGFPASQKFNFIVGSRGWAGDPALICYYAIAQKPFNFN
jgi:hypothetical protein